MDWWQWLIVAIVIIGLLVAGFAMLQARRRHGGVKTTKRGT